MNSKKVIVLLFAVLTGQFAVASDVDLYRGLLFWIKDQKNIEGNELRQTTYPLSKVFDGSFNNPPKVTAMPRGGNHEYTFSLSFKVEELNCKNRLLVIGTQNLNLAANNSLLISGLETSFVVDAVDKYDALAFRVDSNKRLTVYAALLCHPTEDYRVD